MKDSRKNLPIVVLGATGMVGQRAVALLGTHPWFRVAGICASSRSEGKPYRHACRWLFSGDAYAGLGDTVIQKADPAAIKIPPSIAISALDNTVAGDIERRFAEAGWAVVTNAGTHRMRDDIPLIIPEINPDHIALARRQPWPGIIVANPNCTAIPLSLSLAPLSRVAEIAEVCVASYQAVSGAGFPGESSWDMLANVRPHPGNEEEKLGTEPLKILGKLEGDRD